MIIDSINWLELLAATSAVRSRLNILLRIDNTMAVAYINHLGVKRERQLDKELVDVVWRATYTSQPHTFPHPRTPLQM